MRRFSLKQIRTNELKTQYFSWILSLVLVLLATFGIFLYWRGYLVLWGLFFWLVGLILIGLLFVVGVHMGRREGFVDGFEKTRKVIDEARKKEKT